MRRQLKIKRDTFVEHLEKANILSFCANRALKASETQWHYGLLFLCTHYPGHIIYRIYYHSPRPRMKQRNKELKKIYLSRHDMRHGHSAFFFCLFFIFYFELLFLQKPERKLMSASFFNPINVCQHN
jgi:hypothetical protein